MANSPDGGLITETNAQYYEGTQYFFRTDITQQITCDLDTVLKDAVNSPANYKIFVSITGGTLPSDFALLDLIISSHIFLISTSLNCFGKKLLIISISLVSAKSNS